MTVHNQKSASPPPAHRQAYRQDQQLYPVYNLTIKKPIVLVGLMGTGKTALGSRLARILGVNFCDSDQMIEDQSNLSISDIFDIAGEGKFREIEERVISEVLSGSPLVLSTGGGAFCQDRTRAVIRDRAISLWLDAEPETLARRIGNTSSRPLLAKGDPVSILTALAADRKPFYSQADLYLKTGLQSHRQSMKLLLDMLEQSGHITKADNSRNRALLQS